MATKQEILEYVMNTPGNTNPNVLRPMLESISGQTPTIFEATGEVISTNTIFTLADTENEPVMGDILQIAIEGEEDPLIARWVQPLQTVLLPQSGLRTLIYNEEENSYLFDIANFIPQVLLTIDIDDNSSGGTIYATTAPGMGNNQLVSLIKGERATGLSITVSSPLNAEGPATFMVVGIPLTPTDTLYVANSSNIEYSLNGNSCTISVPFSESTSYISFGFRQDK